MSKGRLLVIEGLDGSGKATQAKLLATHLAESGRRVMEITFPDYESDSSALVKMYLSGQFGDKPDDVNPYAASSFYAVDRYASYKTKWGSFYEAGGIVIADRYTTSNAVHQCSKLPPEQWDDFLRWAFDYEYRLLGLPAPDAVVYLQVDPAVSQKLMTGRYHGDESRKDVHEKDIEYLARSRRVQPDSPQFPARLQALEEIDDGGRGEGLQRRAAQEQSASEHPQRQRRRRKQCNGIAQRSARNADGAQHFQRDERPPGEEAVPVQRVRRRPAQHDAPCQRREQQHEPGERCAR